MEYASTVHSPFPLYELCVLKKKSFGYASVLNLAYLSVPFTCLSESPWDPSIQLLNTIIALNHHRNGVHPPQRQAQLDNCLDTSQYCYTATEF